MKCPLMSAIYFNFKSIINIALKTSNDEMGETISVVLKRFLGAISVSQLLVLLKYLVFCIARTQRLDLSVLK